MEAVTASARDIIFFMTFLATALAMGAALAHALELPNKMLLGREEYFIVQQVYRGWNKLAYLLAVEVAGMLLLISIVGHDRDVRRRLAAALASVALAQGAFWLFTYRANQVTADWTLQPENWEQLRRQWEYSHLAGAVFQTMALCAVTLAWIEATRRTKRRPG